MYELNKFKKLKVTDDFFLVKIKVIVLIFASYTLDTVLEWYLNLLL